MAIVAQSSFAFLVLPLLLLCCSGFIQAKPSPPNIILLLADDLGWSQTSVPLPNIGASAHSSYIETPNLARLADNGMRFSSGYASAPVCTPSRRAILNGVSTLRSGARMYSSWVPHDHLTLPTALKAVDPTYVAAVFGKWGGDNNGSMGSTPELCGFDESDGGTSNSDGSEGSKATLSYVIDEVDPKQTESLTTKGVDFMTRQTEAGKPFYLQISYYAPHVTIACRQATLDKYTQKGDPDRNYPPAFAAMIDELDTGIGRLIDSLDTLGIKDNTYVFFTSDNGGKQSHLGARTDSASVNTPLKGSKFTIYEGGIRVPFIVSGPGLVPNSFSETPVIGYDLLATFVDLAGGSTSSLVIDGTSIAPLFSNPTEILHRRDGGVGAEDSYLFWVGPQKGTAAVRSPRYKVFQQFDVQAGSLITHQMYDINQADLVEGRGHWIRDDPELTDEMQTALFKRMEAHDLVELSPVDGSVVKFTFDKAPRDVRAEFVMVDKKTQRAIFKVTWSPSVETLAPTRHFKIRFDASRWPDQSSKRHTRKSLEVFDCLERSRECSSLIAVNAKYATTVRVSVTMISHFDFTTPELTGYGASLDNDIPYAKKTLFKGKYIDQGDKDSSSASGHTHVVATFRWIPSGVEGKVAEQASYVLKVTYISKNGGKTSRTIRMDAQPTDYSRESKVTLKYQDEPIARELVNKVKMQVNVKYADGTSSEWSAVRNDKVHERKL